MLLEQPVQQRRVADVPFHEFRPLAGDRRHPFQGFAAAVAEVVEHQHPAPRFQQQQYRVRADVTGAAGNQNRIHCVSFPP